MLIWKNKLVQLHHCKGMTQKRLSKLITQDPLLQTPLTNIQQFFSFSSEQQKTFRQDVERFSTKNMLHIYKQYGVEIISIVEDNYPKLLKEIYDPPLLLYTKGNTDVLQSIKTLGVVGTRLPTREGVKTIHSLVGSLAEQEWVIVSGLAKGIDGLAHQVALQKKGKTIAVIAGGLFHLYPRENIPLAEEIIKENVIISEYPPTSKPERWQFPERNRLISGISRGVLIVQAKIRSGSLITADCALEQGRDVFAIPGSIFDQHYEGTNWLIQQGAKLVATFKDIEQEYENYSPIR